MGDNRSRTPLAEVGVDVIQRELAKSRTIQCVADKYGVSRQAVHAYLKDNDAYVRRRRNGRVAWRIKYTIDKVCDDLARTRSCKAVAIEYGVAMRTVSGFLAMHGRRATDYTRPLEAEGIERVLHSLSVEGSRKLVAIKYGVHRNTVYLFLRKHDIRSGS